MIRIAVISNVNFEPYLKPCFTEVFSDNIEITYIYLNSVFEIRTFDVDFALLYLHLSEWSLVPDITGYIDMCNKCTEIYGTVREKTNAQILWLGFEDYYLKESNVFGNLLSYHGLSDKLNLYISEILDETDVLIDFKRIIAEVGINNSYNAKGKYRWNSPYSEILIKKIAEEVYTQYCIAYSKTKKCLTLDCDGVLWGGILNEDGIEGIDISEKYKDFQRFVLRLLKGGVILCICSKNDKETLSEVLKSHTGMLLKDTDFAIIRAGYTRKADNIREMAGLLHISPDSIVFVDDSAEEIKEMNFLLPEVQTVLFDPYTVYRDLSCFKLKENNSDTAKIRAMNFKAEQASIDTMNTIGETEIHPADSSEWKRISELSMRTNQKTNGGRFTIGGLKTLLDEKGTLYSVYYKDTVSDYGLIGAMAIQNEKVKLFSLSCRVIGKGVEEQMANYLLKQEIITDIAIGNTGKNADFSAWLKERMLNCNYVNKL